MSLTFFRSLLRLAKRILLYKDGSARVEFPLINGRKTVNINGVEFTEKQLGGKMENGKLIFEIASGDYIAK